MLSPLETEDGLFGLSVIRDISERKQTEEELRRAHDQLELRVQERTAELLKANEKLRLAATVMQDSNDAITGTGSRRCASWSGTVARNGCMAIAKMKLLP